MQFLFEEEASLRLVYGVAGASAGFSGQGCLGYRPRISFLTSE